MDPNDPETATSLKRKRSPVDESGGRQPPSNVTLINYLTKARTEKLRLIEGDSETFAEVLSILDDYEGVLQRHESLAANLGAKLVGPLLLKSFEKLFDGPIKVVQSAFNYSESPVTWLDIVTFARTNPLEFILSDKENMPGLKVCRFWINGGQVEITEDDYRLVMSGGPERMIPTQPIPDDESAELGTLNILETRLAMLIKKADAVASKARQLNYHLKGRKAAVLSRKAAIEPPFVVEAETRTFSPQPFSAINAHTRSQATAAKKGESGKFQAQLLEQFLTHERRPASHRAKTSRTSEIEVDRRLSHPPPIFDDGTEGQHRLMMSAKIEKLGRGDPIWPPCDRCRRLKFNCTKHLTACQACTKKHAKCAWREIREGELEPGAVYSPQQTVVENGYGNAGSETGGLASPGIGAAMSGAGRSENGRDSERLDTEHVIVSKISNVAAAVAQ